MGVCRGGRRPTNPLPLPHLGKVIRSWPLRYRMEGELMNYDEARALGEDLKNRGIDRYGRLELREDSEEFGGGYSLRLHTSGAKLSPGLMGLLSECGCATTLLGPESEYRRYLWLIHPDESEGGERE